MKTFTIFVGLLTLFQMPSAAWAGRESGGGIDDVIDFNASVLQIAKWLEVNGASLAPAVNATTFYQSAAPDHIEPVNDLDSKGANTFYVTNRCDGRKPQDASDLRQACYSAKTDKIYLSEARYPIHEEGAEKLGLIAHEVFRRMGIEGDGYEVSRQMSLVTVPGGPAQSDIPYGIYKVTEAAPSDWPNIEIVPGTAYGRAVFSFLGANGAFIGLPFDCSSAQCLGNSFQYLDARRRKCLTSYRVLFLEDRHMSVNAEVICGNQSTTTGATYRLDHAVSANSLSIFLQSESTYE